MVSFQILDQLSHQLLQDRAEGAEASLLPVTAYPIPAPMDLVLQ